MKKISARDARQGQKGRPVLVVLLCSLLMAIFFWIGLEIYGRIASENNDSFANDNQVPEVTTPIETSPAAQ